MLWKALQRVGYYFILGWADRLSFGICFEPYVRKAIDVIRLVVIRICPVQEQKSLD